MENFIEKQINLSDSFKSLKEDMNTYNFNKNHKHALLLQLESLSSNLLETVEHEQKLVQIDKQKLEDNKLQAPVPTEDNSSSKKGKKSNSKDKKKVRNKSKKSKKKTMFDQEMENSNALQALILGGINNQIQTNKIISSLSKGGEEISEIAGEASKQGNDWMENFYKYGVATGAPGSIDKNPPIVQFNKNHPAFFIYYSNNQYYWAEGKLVGGVWKPDTGNLQTGVPVYPFFGDKTDYENQLQNAKNSAKKSNGNWKMIQPWKTVSGIPGAIEKNDTATIQRLTTIWTYVQQQVSQVNNQYQTVAGLPSTMMQSLTQAVNTSMSGNTSTIQAMGTAVGLINGWAGV